MSDDTHEETEIELPEGDKIDRGEVKKIIAQRQKLKAENAAQAAELKAFKDAEKAAQAEKDRAAQNWAALEKAKDAEVAELRAKIAEREEADELAAKDARQAKFVAAVTKAAGLAPEDAEIIEGVLLKQERKGMDIAPEHGADKIAKDFAKTKLRELAPRLFKTTDLGPKKVAGSNDGPPPLDDEDKAAQVAKIEALARALSSGRPKSP